MSTIWRRRRDLPCTPTSRRGHTWTYHPRTIGGWGIVRCTSCGTEDIY